MPDTRHVSEKLAEEWRPIEGWPYEVSSLGRVRRADNPGHSTYAGRVINQTTTSHGYRRVTLRHNGRLKYAYVHALVAAAFLGPRPVGQEVCHGDGDRGNNAPNNLRWDTRKANQADRIKHGTDHRGERHPAARLTREQVLEIRRRCAEGESQAALAAEYGVKRQAIGDACSGRNWGWLDG